MILLNNVNLSLDTDFNDLSGIIAQKLKTDIKNIKSVKLHKKSVDARHKNNVQFCCSFLVEVFKNEENIVKKIKNAQTYNKVKYVFKEAKHILNTRPVVVGFGPSGMFAALVLAKAGLKPLVIERGSDVDTRTKDVNTFLNGGKLNENSNVQFGEGGAGTFSDGKLNSGIKDIRCSAVLETFVKYGAPKEILTDAKAHIGTDILVKVVKNLREDIISLGGEVRFNSKFENFKSQNGKLKSITVNGEELLCETLILATGHSARDTYEMLKENNVSMVRKPFSMGVRIEHLQEDINKALYGKFFSHKNLKAADYKLAVHLLSGRGVYTFCMCPGGEVINSSSEDFATAVNGMSYSKRDGKNANSAVLVSVEPDDLDGDDVLEGCYLQREIEKKAYSMGDGKVPITTVGEFVYGKKAKIGRIIPTVKPDYTLADLKEIFPKFIVESLKEGIVEFDKKISGFACDDAILTAPETRSSSPVRILRLEDGNSQNIKGIYPAGEGAGYAGGIMSAAVDGMKVAEKIIE